MSQTAETESIVGPGATAVAWVEWFVPEYHLDYVTAGLDAQHLKSAAYVSKAFMWTLLIVIQQIPPSFRWGLCSVEAVAWTIGYTGEPKALARFIAVIAALLALTVFDAYRYPMRGNVIRQGLDTAGACVFVFAVQMLLKLFAPDHVLHGSIMSQGLLMGLLTVSMMRALFRRKARPEEEEAQKERDRKRNKPPRELSVMTARAITISWFSAAVILAAMNPVGEAVPIQGLWLIFIPGLSFLIAWRLGEDGLDGGISGGFVTIFMDHGKDAAKHKRVPLFKKPESNKPRPFPWHIFCEILALVSYCSPLAIARFTSANIGWPAYAAYAEACVALAVLWVAVRQMNQELADKILADAEKGEK